MTVMKMHLGKRKSTSALSAIRGLGPYDRQVGRFPISLSKPHLNAAACNRPLLVILFS